ncbi:beta-hexosaminidase subunit beta-like isoform X2 [Sipha flava]|nr:beta-hexosaminidase subunit beta-like isoform X2 [Sipha flava]
MTHGQVWPKPVIQNSYNVYLEFEQENFYFNSTGYSCDLLHEAFKRYKGLLFLKAKKTSQWLRRLPKNKIAGTLEKLNVKLLSPCEDYPSLNMDEKYEIKIRKSGGTLMAKSIWGILRGLESFSQLIIFEKYCLTFVIRCTSITDYPKFRHRGLLLDTSRHYLPVQTIISMLDAMSYSKLNVFHWHIIDDNSFPYQSKAFPSLSDKGAYGQSAIYSTNDIKLVIEHARQRGIRVIPEIDSPGHTLSWGLGGIPGLLTQCSDTDPNYFGPIDPTVDENYSFIKTLLTEVNELFRDQYLHLGGDEVNMNCWNNSKKLQTFMTLNNISNVEGLEDYYFKHIFNITRELKTVPIVWEELFSDNIHLDHNVVVQIWKPNNFSSLVQEVIDSGYAVLISSCWYLNYIKYGSDWSSFYNCDLSDIVDRNNLLLGGEACVWGEFVDETNVLPLSWPRASAVAEVLWSQVTNYTEARLRLEEHTCRMKRRGVPAQPANGPGFCTY